MGFSLIFCCFLQLWHELCDLISQNPDKVTSLNVGAIIRGGLTRFTDQLGKLWCSLADYYIRSGHFEKVSVVKVVLFKLLAHLFFLIFLFKNTSKNTLSGIQEFLGQLNDYKSLFTLLYCFCFFI